jgi:rare lipoprotein A
VLVSILNATPDVLFEEFILLKKLTLIFGFLLLPTPSAFANCTEASYYSSGSITASGSSFNPYGNTVAHPYYKFGTRLRIINQRNGLIAYGVVRDRGPFVSGRSIDMSLGLFQQIESPSRGVARVCYSKV